MLVELASKIVQGVNQHGTYPGVFRVSIFGRDRKGATGATGWIALRTALEPFIEHRFPACERLSLVFQ
jgi:hypothetical protein